MMRVSTRRQAVRRVATGSRKALRDALHAWPYWLRLAVALGLAVVLVAMLGSSRPLEAVLLALVLGAVWLRFRVGAVALRAFIVSIVAGYLLVDATGLHWTWLALLGLIVVIVGVYRQVGSLRPRLIGVPRPESVLEATSPVSRTDDEGVRLVDALDERWGSTRPDGPRQGWRAVHSHGSGARGSFTPTAEPRFGVFDIFCHPLPVGAIVRFSNTLGTLPRDDSVRRPHGMAIRLLPEVVGDVGMDLVLADGKRFPVSTADDFYGFLRRFGRWLRYIPFALLGRTRVLALLDFVPILRPSSYATRTYHGVNTFLWCDQPVRYLAVPRDVPPVRTRAGDRRWRLDRDLRDRLAMGTVEYELRLVSGRGLPEHLRLDARRAWPRLMPSWALGTLRLTTYVEPVEIDAFGFDPFRLPPGVEPSADEILLARRAAYPESRARRCPLEVRSAVDVRP